MIFHKATDGSELDIKHVILLVPSSMPHIPCLPNLPSLQIVNQQSHHETDSLAQGNEGFHKNKTVSSIWELQQNAT